MRPRILQQNQKWSKWLKTLCSSGCRIIHIGKNIIVNQRTPLLLPASSPVMTVSHPWVCSPLISGCWHKWSLLYQHRSKGRAGTFRDRNATTVRLHYKASTVSNLSSSLASFVLCHTFLMAPTTEGQKSCTGEARLWRLNYIKITFRLFSLAEC